MVGFFQKLGIFVGIFLIINSLMVIAVSVLSLGNFLPALLGTTILLYSFFYEKIDYTCKDGILKIFHNIFKIGFSIFIVSFTVCTAVVYHNSVKEPPANADAVIVLGAGLRGENVSLSLAHRLDAAARYYFENENTVLVVSGGQGKNEAVTEASAMKNYLLFKGIPEDKIIEENKSSRTVENFKFSKNILDDLFKSNNYTVIYATNGFHIFRAGMIASQEGLNAFGLNSESVTFLAPTQYLQEYFSIIKFYAIDYK